MVRSRPRLRWEPVGAAIPPDDTAVAATLPDSAVADSEDDDSDSDERSTVQSTIFGDSVAKFLVPFYIIQLHQYVLMQDRRDDF